MLAGARRNAERELRRGRAPSGVSSVGEEEGEGGGPDSGADTSSAEPRARDPPARARARPGRGGEFRRAAGVSSAEPRAQDPPSRGRELDRARPPPDASSAEPRARRRRRRGRGAGHGRELRRARGRRRRGRGPDPDAAPAPERAVASRRRRRHARVGERGPKIFCLRRWKPRNLGCSLIHCASHKSRNGSLVWVFLVGDSLTTPNETEGCCVCAELTANKRAGRLEEAAARVDPIRRAITS